MMDSHTTIRSYPKIYNLGHKAIAALFDGPVFVQEKYDGSQLSWMWATSGELFVKSKGKLQCGGNAVPDKMFSAGIKYLLSLVPIYDYIFRGEYFQSASHNTLTYDRMPSNGLVLYDVESLKSESAFYSDVKIYELAYKLGVEHAYGFDAFDSGEVGLSDLEKFLERESSLGGPKVEGIVIKNYTQFTRDGKVMMGKLVSEQFKERHQVKWKSKNPSIDEVLGSITEALNTEARYLKAVQHLRDDSTLLCEVADIGPLIKAVKEDVTDEEAEWIKDQLYAFYAAKIIRGIGAGLPAWYKARLAEQQFAGGN